MALHLHRSDSGSQPIPPNYPMKTLLSLFLTELADMYDAEKRIASALPKMAKAATSPELKSAFESHLAETEGHIEKVERVFECFDEEPSEEVCEATEGLLKEADELAAEYAGSPALDAGLICAAQKVEHYEIASYGCLVTWARLLGNGEAADILETILDQEKSADERLSEIATGESNEDALEEEEDRTAYSRSTRG
jgi:ferritin-like metal-binding protein YciE